MNEIKNRLLENLEILPDKIECKTIDPEFIILKSDYFLNEKTVFFLYVELIVYKKEKKIEFISEFEYESFEIIFFESFVNIGQDIKFKYKKEEIKNKIQDGLFL